MTSPLGGAAPICTSSAGAPRAPPPAPHARHAPAGVLARAPCMAGGRPSHTSAARCAPRRALPPEAELDQLASDMVLSGQLDEIELPRLHEMHHALNLTNGLEAAPILSELGLPYSFTRLQSTACEQQLFNQILLDVGPDLMMRLALGETVCVWDFGSRNRKRGIPRALWYGLEWTRWCLEREWLGRKGDGILRGYNVTREFVDHANSLEKGVKRRVRYFKQFCPADMERVSLVGAYRATEHDDDKEFYRRAASALQLRPGHEQRSGGDVGALPAREVLRRSGFKLFVGGACHSEYQRAKRRIIAEREGG
ncbi:unnamed protein product [Pedinophyceae sp. YPF-701]|nr:unnamed protein product [Pedinophyceae sp. YPF-701]